MSRSVAFGLVLFIPEIKKLFFLQKMVYNYAQPLPSISVISTKTSL